MTRNLTSAILLSGCLATTAVADFAAEVVSYDQGTTASGSVTDATSALGRPAIFNGSVPITPFNPPFSANQIVSVGEGGELTLRLERFALPTAGPELGFFVNNFIINTDFPNTPSPGGIAGPTLTPTSGTFGIESTEVLVSELGIDWVSLGVQTLDIPTFGTTLTGDPSDAQKPFTGVLGDFASLDLPGMQAVVNGGAGGTWLDIEPTGLPRVGFVRFTIADDMNPGTSLNFELDAVAVASAATGGIVPEPGTAAFALMGLAAVGSCRRNNRS